MLVVHPSMPIKTVNDLIGLAKKRPGELNFSVGGPGTSNYVAAILFNHMAGVNVVRIPYKGTGPALAAVMAGEVHAMFGSAGGAAPHLQSGRLRAIAVGSEKPSALAPGVPTMEQSGLKGFVSEALHALFAPAGTPPAVIARLNQEVGRYLNSAEAREVFVKAGIDPAPGTPEELTQIMRSEIARIDKVLKAAGGV
jgi:tripartite-type tricarboxylate transporter receptor subunit TctC